MAPAFLVTLGCLEFLNNVKDDDVFKNLGFTILMPGLNVVLITYTIRHFYQLSRKIVITQDEVFIGRTRISLDQMKHISVREKAMQQYLFRTYPLDACVLTLENGEEVTIAVEQYINAHLIRMNLDNIRRKIVGETDSFLLTQHADDDDTSHELFDVDETATIYRQSAFKSLNNWLWVVLCIFLMGIVIFSLGRDVPIAATMVPFAFCCMCYMVLIVYNHYFIVTDEHLVVKNPFFPLRERVFRIDNIDFLERDYSGKETGLMFMTKNFRIYRFRSALLTHKMYADLIRKVNERQNPNSVTAWKK